MEELRMNTLLAHQDRMDESLKAMLHNYMNYAKKRKPTICVLCSDSKLRTEVDRVFTVRKDIYVDVIVTSEEINEKDKFEAMLCDALVVCTRAKNIAPKGLYDLVKYIAQLDKQIYVILAGWESIERNISMAKSRDERVFIEFDFARVMDVINVFDLPCDGFVTWNNSFDELALYFIEKYDVLHQIQDEKIYTYMLKYVEDFYVDARTEINKEIATLNNAERIAMAKQDYYGVRFSNLAVSIQEVVDSVRTSIEDISYYDIVNEEKNETLTDIYSRSGVDAQQYAKAFLINEYKKRISSLNCYSDEKVRVDNESCVSECINEMNTLVYDISKLVYLPEKLLNNFKKACDERRELEKIVNRYESSTKRLIDNIVDRIPAKVGEYRFEMKYSVEVRDNGKDLLGMTKNVLKDFLSIEKKDSGNSGEDDSYIKKSYRNEHSSEVINNRIQKDIGEEEDTLMLDRFQSDIEQLIYYSRNACGEMAQDRSKIIKEDMEKFADSILKIYFGSVIKEIEEMQSEMSNILKEYYLE